MQNWKKIFIGISVSLAAIAVFIFLIAYIMLQRTLPEYEGEYTVSGLKSEITIYRDSFAVPIIITKDSEDAAFALGYLHAQERLFQMDVARRAGEGRLSEVFGEKTIPIDRMFRTIGIVKHVEQTYNQLNPLTKKILEAYSKGVNASIQKSKGKYQIEFDALGYDPYLWKPEHSLVIAKLMGWELNISWWSDVAFSNIIQKIGEEKAKELLPDFPQNAPTIIPKELKTFASLPTGIINVDRMYRDFVGFTGTHIGSNSWVVNGNMSNSGKPIIANDPHLVFSTPGKWYFVLVRSDDWNAEGFTMPGLPSIVIGKNENISWTMTNVMADDADFYVEKIDSTGKNYFLNNEWKELQVDKDSFVVKNSTNYVFEIKRTHRGPIVSDIHPNNVQNENELKTTLSMRWTGLEFSDEVFASISINRAANWQQFKEALKHFTLPGQNFVYADKEGNIGYICAARLPVRSNPSPTLVYDGTTDAYDWKGFVPYEEMPKLFNPPQNYIASANNKTASSFKYHISNLWEPSSRIERITELLTSKKIHSTEDYKNYQNDFTSPYARSLTKYILSAFNNVKVTDENLKIVIELFDNWDFKLNSSSQIPTIYSSFLHHLIKNIFEDELGTELLLEYIYIANIPYRKVLEILQAGNSFIDDINTPAIETKEDIIRKSLVDALTALEKTHGKEIKNWQWGNVHHVTFKHMFSGASKFTDKLLNIGPFGIGGDGTTIFNTEYSFTDIYEQSGKENFVKLSTPYENILGPSMRFIYDFGNPGYAEFILPTGQSGHFMSEHYQNMTEDWLKGRYLRIPLSTEEFIERSKHKLKLLSN